MPATRRLLAFTVLAFACLATGKARAQDDSFDARLETYRRYMRARELVRGGSVRPHWLADGGGFWFRADDRKARVFDRTDGSLREAASPEELPAWTAARSATRDWRGRIHDRDHERYVQVRGHDLFAGGADQAARRLTTDGEPDWSWNLPAEPFSPDGERIVALRIDLREVYHLTLTDYSKAIPTVSRAPYVKSGSPGAKTSLFAFELATGQRTEIRLAGHGETEDPEAYVLTDGFGANDPELIVLRLSRDAKRLDLIAADPKTGAARIILTETRDTFVGGLDFVTEGWRAGYTPLENGDRFIWRSERDGRAHLYLYARDGTLLRRLTSGSFVVDRVEAIDELGGTVFFSASTGERPYDRQLYRVGLDGRAMRRLTEEPGVHRFEFSPSAAVLLDTHSSVSRAPAVDLRDADGRTLHRLSEADIGALSAIGWTPPETFVVDAADGETELHGVLFKPHDFDPERSYAIIDYIYAGPQTTVVPHAFVGDTRMPVRAQALAQMGYVVFMVDGRGTPGRGKAFQDVTYGCIGRHEIEDHVATLRQLAAGRPYVDLGRVGVFGASWGGYFAIRAMFTAPDVFHVGVSFAPGDLTEAAVINEPYMDLPSRNPDGYAFGSILHGAGDFTGELLIAHGTSDVNAPFSTSMRVVDALIRAGKRHEFVVLPGETHSPSAAALRYFENAMLRFLERHLKP